MATSTCSVRFDFITGLRGKVTYVYNIPRSLVTPTPGPDDHQIFQTALRPIFREHETAHLAASEPKCQSCGSPSVRVMNTPMPWLHVVEDPFITVLVNPLCDKTE